MKKSTSTLRFSVALAIAAAINLAFTPDQDPQPQPQEVEVEFEQVEAWTTPEGEQVTLLTGNVVLTAGEGVVVRADRMLVWSSPEGEADEVYAEGNVRYRRTADEVFADSLYFHLAERRGILRGFQLRGIDETSGLPFIVRADEAREVEPGVFQGDNVVITSCDYGDPHYDVTLDSAEIRGIDRRPGAQDLDLFPYTSYRATGTGIVPHLFGVPFFYVPYATMTPGQETYIRRIRVGRSDNFGRFVLTTTGITIPRRVIDPLLPGVQATPENEDDPWGDLEMRLDFRERRGWAFGPRLEYEDDDYSGRFDAYFALDRGPGSATAFNQQFSRVDDDDRGRVRLFHRHEITDELRGELEFHWLSDRFFQQEFFPREFKNEKAPETTAYLRWLRNNIIAYGQVRPRLNDFQTQEEFLPRLGFQATTVPVMEGLTGPWYLNVRSEFGNYRLRQDQQARIDEPRTWRWDSEAELDQPIRLAWGVLRPWVGLRLTAYENDANEEATARLLGSYGFDYRTELARTYDYDSSLLGIHGMRHVASFLLGFSSTPGANTSREDFSRIDFTDRAWKYEELFFEMRHRLQTRIRTPATDEEPEGWATQEFLEAFAGIEFYPDPRRDTGFANENSFLFPHRWITLPADRGAEFSTRSWSNVHLGVSITPRDYFSFSWRAEYDPVHGGIPRTSESLTLTPIPQATFALSHNFVSGVTDAYSLRAELRFWDKWILGGSTNYDARTSDFLRNVLFVERDLHDFVIRFEFVDDNVRDDTQFLFSFFPKFLPRDVTEPVWRAFGEE